VDYCICYGICFFRCCYCIIFVCFFSTMISELNIIIILMCHGYKQANPNWCCQLLPCFNGERLVRWCQIFEVLHLQPQNVQSDRIFVPVGIVGLSHVRARQCTITPSLQDVEFWEHKTPDFMFSCCSVLTR